MILSFDWMVNIRFSPCIWRNHGTESVCNLFKVTLLGSGWDLLWWQGQSSCVVPLVINSIPAFCGPLWLYEDKAWKDWERAWEHKELGPTSTQEGLEGGYESFRPGTINQMWLGRKLRLNTKCTVYGKVNGWQGGQLTQLGDVRINWAETGPWGP